MIPAGASTFIASKKQTDELGVEAASEQIAGTGPWEIVDHHTTEFWRMEAVEDHWRQTPYFAELVFWEIPEESARVAGCQTGQLDTFLMSFDTIPLVEAVEGARLMSIPNAVDMRLRIYGNWYPIPGVEARADYDPNLPWVSAGPDVNSPEWEGPGKFASPCIWPSTGTPWWIPRWKPGPYQHASARLHQLRASPGRTGLAGIQPGLSPGVAGRFRIP